MNIKADKDQHLEKTIEVRVSEGVLGTGEFAAKLELTLVHHGNASLQASEDRSSVNSVSECRWNGRTRVWRIRKPAGSPVLADPEAVGKVAKRLEPLVAKVREGLSFEWDDRKGCEIGVLTEDATAASAEIETVMEERGDDWISEIVVWDACEWISHNPIILHPTITYAINDRAEKINAIAKDMGVYLICADASGIEAVILALHAIKEEELEEQELVMYGFDW